MSRHDAAVYTAQRLEMLHIVEDSLYYLVQRPVIHSELSGWPFMVTFYFEPFVRLDISLNIWYVKR